MKWRVILGILMFAVAVGYPVVSVNNAGATINRQINFQGKLTNPDGTNLTNGSYTIAFNIYTVSSGGATVWTESKSVTVTDGIFQTNLGDTTSLPGSVDFNNSSLYLGITVSADAEMTPRIRLTAAPYALNSDSLDGLDSAAFGQLASSQTWTGTNTLQPTTNITSAIIKQTSFGSATADIFNIQTANSTSILQVTGPAVNEAAVTLNSVGATRALTLDSGSGTITFGNNTTTLQKSGTTFTFDLNNAASSAFTVTNAGAGVASLSVEGNITTSATIGTASTTTFTGAGATFSSAVAANGGITFDNSTDTLGAFTLAGTLDANTNILTNIGNTGTDFVATTGALNLAGLLTANGGVTLGANQDITTTAGSGTLTLNSTVTNASDSAMLITPTYTGGATDALTYNGISLAAFSPTNASGTDTVNGLNVGNLTDPGATITSNGINIGTGWDKGINSSSSIVINAGGAVNLQVTAASAPTADLATFSNSGQASATSGIDGVLVTFSASNASGDAIHITPSFTGGATDTLTYNALEVDAFSPTNAAGTDAVNGLKLGNLTDPGATITSTALNLGTGWDTLIGGTTAGTDIFNFTNFDVSSAGAISSVTTYTGSGNINTTGGSIQTNSTTRVDNSGNLTNIGNFTGAAGVTYATTGANGHIFKPGTDNANAFRVQNAGATLDIFNIDTTSAIITIKGTTSTFTNLTLTDAHFKVTQTNAPTIGTPSACGTSPTAAVTAGSTDNAGSFYINAGTTSTGICTTVITFNKAFGAAPKAIILTPNSTLGGTLPANNTTQNIARITGTSSTTFTVALGNVSVVSVRYGFNYWVIE